MTQGVMAISCVGVCGCMALGQSFVVSASAPAFVLPGQQFNVDVWGSVSGAPWTQGVSAMAAFQVNLLGSGPIAQASNIVHGSLSGGATGSIVGVDAIGVSGFQLPNFAGANPSIDLSNPILLYSIVVDAGALGTITYTPSVGLPGQTLAFYPDATQFATIQVLPPLGGLPTLSLLGVSVQVIPSAGGASAAVLLLGGAAARRRR